MPTAGGTTSVNTTGHGHHDTEEVYEVESIVGTQAVSRKRFYLIKWVGDNRLTWEPVGNLEGGCVKAVAAFKKQMGWSKLPQDDAMHLRADVEEVHVDGETTYVLTSKKRKSSDVSFHTSESKRARMRTSAVSSADEGKGTKLVVDACRVSQTAGTTLNSSATFEWNTHGEQTDALTDDSGCASDVSFAEDADRTNVDAIVEWILSEDQGFISPAASRSTTPLPTSPAKTEHWFNASFNVDLVCPFPVELERTLQELRDLPTTEDQSEAVATPSFSSVDDFKMHMSGALSQPLFGNAWASLYGRKFTNSDRIFCYYV